MVSAEPADVESDGQSLESGNHVLGQQAIRAVALVHWKFVSAVRHARLSPIRERARENDFVDDPRPESDAKDLRATNGELRLHEGASSGTHFPRKVI